ncbi:MAG: hypothetical protein ACYTFK_07480 [Planctomycetota bacterium]|jgi:hypothetical protein
MKFRAKIAIILILSLLSCVVGVFGADQEVPGQRAKRRVFVREGFVLDGVPGRLTRAKGSEDKWVFAADVDFSDGKGVIKAGELIELLPSGTLEQITAQIEEGKDGTDIRLWAIVTRYSNRNRLSANELEDISLHEDFFDKNFLFAWYFVPMGGIRTEPTETEGEEKAEPQEATEKKEDSIIPADVMAKLKPKRMVNLAKLKKLDIQGDMMLVGRTGFVVQGEQGKVFVIDGLGRNVEDISFRLLGCEVLERTEANLAGSPYRQRYRVAARVTKYKGEVYMLLQRATRTYSHGNFAR